MIFAFHGKITNELLDMRKGMHGFCVGEISIRLNMWMKPGADATFVFIREINLDASVINGEVLERLAIWILPGHLRGVTMCLDENGVEMLARQFRLCETGIGIVRGLRP